MPVRTVVNLWPLFLGLSLIGLAVGVQASLLGFRAELEGFDDGLIGLVMSAYFAGFLAGSMLAPKLIHQVGHIRTFGAVTALASITILVHASFVEPWTWAAMRLLTGFAFSSIYVVAESWLNQAADNRNRGQLLSIYMVILLAGTTAGQFMLNLADPAGFTLFILISIMVSFAAIPILMTVLPAPELEETVRVSVAHLWRRAPMGVIGIVLVQWCTSVVFGMGAVYAAKLGMTVEEVAWFMGSMMAGGMVLQWPLGKLSDLVDRRWVMGFASIFAVVAALFAAGETEAGWEMYAYVFLFGGFCLSQYSLIVALTHDHLRPAEIVPASGTIVMLSGWVSISGPLMVAFGIGTFGLYTFFPMLAAVLLLMAVISILRVIFVPALPQEYKTHSTMQAPATPVGSVLHPEEKEVV
ncbi:MAG: MFS transporter [Halieaceae bacterium]